VAALRWLADTRQHQERPLYLYEALLHLVVSECDLQLSGKKAKFRAPLFFSVLLVSCFFVIFFLQPGFNGGSEAKLDDLKEYRTKWTPDTLCEIVARGPLAFAEAAQVPASLGHVDIHTREGRACGSSRTTFACGGARVSYELPHFEKLRAAYVVTKKFLDKDWLMAAGGVPTADQVSAVLGAMFHVRDWSLKEDVDVEDDRILPKLTPAVALKNFQLQRLQLGMEKKKSVAESGAGSGPGSDTGADSAGAPRVIRRRVE
jgi:hypothetical protein